MADRRAGLMVKAAAILLLWLSPCGARVWHVAPDSTGDAPTIQAAVDSAHPGDEVLLGPGTYTPATQGGGQAAMVYVSKGITLRGEAGAANTVLDAEQQGRVVWCTVPATVRGLTIRGGLAPIGDIGGGIRLDAGLVSQCVITKNRVSTNSSGAGASIYKGTIEDCEIVGNDAGWDGRGGGSRNRTIADGPVSRAEQQIVRRSWWGWRWGLQRVLNHNRLPLRE